MTVEVYVSRDSQGQPWPPDYSHEAAACLGVIKRLWSAFHGQNPLCVVMANVHRPSADLVIITPRGLGIVEFKHSYGTITAREGHWYAGPVKIQAGAESQNYQNPQEQVQAYAGQIHDRLIHPHHPPPWLPGKVSDWDQLRIQTAVCFTHPDARFSDLRSALVHAPGHNLLGDFTLLGPAELPDWAAALRNQMRRGPNEGYQPYRLSVEQIRRIASGLLSGILWTEITALMPTGKPFAYLGLVEDGTTSQIFGLDREEIFLGRDVQQCSVPVPTRYAKASRVHARIVRTTEAVQLEDLSSTHGTFVNAQRITAPVTLAEAAAITLGGPIPGERVCLLRYSRTLFRFPSTAID